MNNIAKYIVATLLASLIFYGGAGVNLVSYCCGDCRSAGMEVVLSDMCCEIHEHNHVNSCGHTHTHNHSHEATAAEECENHIGDEDCCGLERVSFEWDSYQEPVQKLAPIALDLMAGSLPVSSLLSDLELTVQRKSEPHYPPLAVCPRVYLSLLTTLLI